MRHFPAFHDVTDRSCLVVGAGESAARKVRLLRQAGARIVVVAPRACEELAALAADRVLELRRRPFRSGDVVGQVLVVSATGHDGVDRLVAVAAEAAGVPVNVVDRPDLSSFIVPAIVDRDPIMIGISSGAAAPLLARRIREHLETVLPAGLGRLAAFAESFRGAVKATIPAGTRRLRFWEGVLDGPIAAAVLAGDLPRARERMIAAINGKANDPAAVGRVAIVGAGPGDPDLLTLKALRALQQADVVVYDKLVGDGILELARRDAERIYVGKSKGHHSVTQEQINALLVEQAHAGRRVVRLKGGDPFVFGRGGEEVAALKRHGIETELVPGITAAAGCAAAAGIPLTHRGVAQAVTFVTGHGQDGDPDLDWDALASGGQTLAVYMGVSKADAIAARLIAAGRSADTPVSVVENGTTARERRVIGTLGTFADLMRNQEIAGPALILIGEVVSLAVDSAVATSMISQPSALPLASTGT